MTEKVSNMEIYQEFCANSREPHEPHYDDLAKAGTKRLFSNRSRASDRELDHGENYEMEEEEEQLHSGKRHRASDWPLTSRNTDSPSTRVPLRNRNAPNSPPYHQGSPLQARPSKFLEGSMNDRVSQKPPTTYIGYEECRDRFDQEDGDTRDRKMARPRTFTNHPNTSIAGTDRSEISRHSGIFRFGKSLAASFNPSNWKIFSKPHEENEEAVQEKILRERREKAEAMYQELKKSGHFRDSNFHSSIHHRQDVIPAKHDSGVEFDEQRSTSCIRSTSRMGVETSREEKRMGRVFLEPPLLSTGGESSSHFSQSPASISQDSKHKVTAKFHFKKPSLSNIRKSISENGSIATSTINHQPRRVPSRKDLQKQQKLVKRVSDLEGKLEAARRQLADVMDEPVPAVSRPESRAERIGRARFVPGAMPSLPSERLLSGFCGEGDEGGLSESVSVSQIGKAITVNEPVASRGIYENEHHEMDEPVRHAPSPPNFGRALKKALEKEPATSSLVSLIQSVEVDEEESFQNDDAVVDTGERLKIQNVKSRQVLINKTGTSNPSNSTTNSYSEHSTYSSHSDVGIDSDYQVSESGKHNSSPEPSDVNAFGLKPTKASESSKPPSKEKACKGRKRKNSADPVSVYKPTQESGSDLSSIKPRRTPKSQPRKLQKTSTAGPDIKASPTQGQQNGANANKQSASGKCGMKVAMPPRSVRRKAPVTGSGQGRQSGSPPPNGAFTGLEYAKPSFQPESKISTYSALPTADAEDVPPLPEIPKAVRLADGEVVRISDQKTKISSRRSNGGGQLSHTASKLTKARSSVSPRKEKVRKEKSGKGEKEDFEWPEDVF